MPWSTSRGETLAQVLAKLKDAERETETPFGQKDSVVHFGKLADGLQHAHSKGVVHRDIKPSNLILDGEGRILDFGLARLEGQEALTLSGDFVGTPAYMSPEQAKKQKIPLDHRTDIYSLGVTLYELLTHQQPFRGKDHAETLSQIIERDPRPPRQLNGRVPQDLETIVLKCLRKDTGDRYGTAEALGQDLRRFVRGDPIEARPQSTEGRLGRRFWRYRAAILLLLLAFVGSTTATVLVACAWRWRSGRLAASRGWTTFWMCTGPSPATRTCADGSGTTSKVSPGGALSLQGHDEQVHSVAWSPDSELLASAG